MTQAHAELLIDGRAAQAWKRMSRTDNAIRQGSDSPHVSWYAAQFSWITGVVIETPQA